MDVPIHKLPSVPARSEKIPLDKSFPFSGTQGTNRTPSKRISPFCVPIQRYPSVVCAMAFGAPLKTPSSILQAVCPYCEIRLLGSIAHAVQFNENSKNHIRREREILNWATLAVLCTVLPSQAPGEDLVPAGSPFAAGQPEEPGHQIRGIRIDKISPPRFTISGNKHS